MVKTYQEIPVFEETAPMGGKGHLKLTKPSEALGKPEKVRTFALAELEPGSAVGYHEHHGESETYYILSGSGVYNDNGTMVPVAAGDVTFTPSGEGHGLENSGTEPLKFIALIVLD